MNIENLFLKADDQAAIIRIVERCLVEQTAQPAWDLPSSYDPILASDPKRKIAISPVKDGWVTLIEAKEVVDFGLAKNLSDELGSKIVIVQVSDSTGTMGHLSYENGEVMGCVFDEEAADPLNNVRHFIQEVGIPFDLRMFREVVQLAPQGWVIKQRRQGS